MIWKDAAKSVFRSQRMKEASGPCVWAGGFFRQQHQKIQFAGRKNKLIFHGSSVTLKILSHLPNVYEEVK